jgi:hypothetical protein
MPWMLALSAFYLCPSYFLPALPLHNTRLMIMVWYARYFQGGIVGRHHLGRLSHWVCFSKGCPSTLMPYMRARPANINVDETASWYRAVRPLLKSRM